MGFPGRETFEPSPGERVCFVRQYQADSGDSIDRGNWQVFLKSANVSDLRQIVEKSKRNDRPQFHRFPCSSAVDDQDEAIRENTMTAKEKLENPLPKDCTGRAALTIAFVEGRKHLPIVTLNRGS